MPDLLVASAVRAAGRKVDMSAAQTAALLQRWRGTPLTACAHR